MEWINNVIIFLVITMWTFSGIGVVNMITFKKIAKEKDKIYDPPLTLYISAFSILTGILVVILK